MDRGVGLCVLHYTVFVPTNKGGRQFQDWVGGYFDYRDPAVGFAADSVMQLEL